MVKENPKIEAQVDQAIERLVDEALCFNRSDSERDPELIREKFGAQIRAKFLNTEDQKRQKIRLFLEQLEGTFVRMYPENAVSKISWVAGRGVRNKKIVEMLMRKYTGGLMKGVLMVEIGNHVLVNGKEDDLDELVLDFSVFEDIPISLDLGLGGIKAKKIVIDYDLNLQSLEIDFCGRPFDDLVLPAYVRAEKISITNARGKSWADNSKTKVEADSLSLEMCRQLEDLDLERTFKVKDLKLSNCSKFDFGMSTAEVPEKKAVLDNLIIDDCPNLKLFPRALRVNDNVVIKDFNKIPEFMDGLPVFPAKFNLPFDRAVSIEEIAHNVQCIRGHEYDQASFFVDIRRNHQEERLMYHYLLDNPLRVTDKFRELMSKTTVFPTDFIEKDYCELYWPCAQYIRFVYLSKKQMDFIISRLGWPLTQPMEGRATSFMALEKLADMKDVVYFMSKSIAISTPDIGEPPHNPPWNYLVPKKWLAHEEIRVLENDSIKLVGR